MLCMLHVGSNSSSIRICARVTWCIKSNNSLVLDLQYFKLEGVLANYFRRTELLEEMISS